MSRFIDTNVLVYAQLDDPKSEAARNVIKVGGVISVQVLNEFANVLRRKLSRSWDDIEAAVDDAIILLGPPRPLGLATHSAATNLAKSHSLSFYDALILAAAIEAGCRTLLTEDFQTGAVIGGVRIENPFG